VTHVVVCDGPDPATAQCVGVPAEGFIIYGDSVSAADYSAMIYAVTILFGVAFIVRLILRVMGFK